MVGQSGWSDLVHGCGGVVSACSHGSDEEAEKVGRTQDKLLSLLQSSCIDLGPRD